MKTYYVIATAKNADNRDYKLGPFATKGYAKRCARANAKSDWYVVRIVSQEEAA